MASKCFKIIQNVNFSLRGDNELAIGVIALFVVFYSLSYDELLQRINLEHNNRLSKLLLHNRRFIMLIAFII